MKIYDSYSLPHVDKSINSLRGFTVFFTLYASTGYGQIETDECDPDKTAFTSQQGGYGLTRMPSSLKNVLLTFQMVMNAILVSVQWQIALVYLDKIIVFSKSLWDYIEQVW